MEKILPFNSNSPIKTYSYFADYLGVLLANNYRIDNVLEQHFLFMNYIPFTGQVNFQFKKSLKSRFEYEKFDVGTIDALPFVKNNIINNKYVVILLDDNFLNVNSKHKIGVHNWLIYGFSDEKERIYIAGYVFNNNCGTYTETSISYTELISSVARKLTSIEKNRISANNVFSIPQKLNINTKVKYGLIKKFNFYFIHLNVLKFLIVHNYIFSHFNFNPYKRKFLDLRDLRIIYEQTMVFKDILLKKNDSVFDDELNTLVNLSESVLLEAAVFHCKPNRKSKVESAKNINKKIKGIYKIEKNLSKYIFS